MQRRIAPGRPPYKKRGDVTRLLELRVRVPLFNRVNRICKATGATRSEVLRNILVKHFETVDREAAQDGDKAA